MPLGDFFDFALQFFSLRLFRHLLYTSEASSKAKPEFKAKISLSRREGEFSENFRRFLVEKTQGAFLTAIAYPQIPAKAGIEAWFTHSRK